MIIQRCYLIKSKRPFLSTVTKPCFLVWPFTDLEEDTNSYSYRPHLYMVMWNVLAINHRFLHIYDWLIYLRNLLQREPTMFCTEHFSKSIFLLNKEHIQVNLTHMMFPYTKWYFLNSLKLKENIHKENLNFIRKCTKALLIMITLILIEYVMWWLLCHG